MKEIRYPPLGILDLTVFLFHVVVQILRDVPLVIIFKTAIILLLYLPLVPIEIARDLYLAESPTTMTLLQRFTFKLVRVAFTSFDYRLGNVFFSRRASLSLMRRRFGGQHIFDTYCASVDTTVGGRRITGWWLAPAGHAQYLAHGGRPPPRNNDKSWTICYFHGGGFVMGSPTFYLEFLHNLRLTLAQNRSMRNAAIFVPAYPLAPDAHHLARSNAVKTAWEYLAVHPGVDNSRLVIGGDSAGGTIALGLRMALGLAGTKPEFEAYRCLPSPIRMM